MSSSYRMALNDWLAQLDVKADTVLDIGGAQVPLPGRVKSWNVEQYLIADLPDPHEGDVKPDFEMDLNYTLLDGKHSNTSDLASSDLIFCLEVFDYIWNPVQAMESIAYLLTLRGTAWVTFPSVYPLHQPVEDDALRYMPGGIKKLAAAAGLEIVQMIPRRPETDLWDQFIRAERMRAAKRQDHAFTGWIVEFKKGAR